LSCFICTIFEQFAMNFTLSVRLFICLFLSGGVFMKIKSSTIRQRQRHWHWSRPWLWNAYVRLPTTDCRLWLMGLMPLAPPLYHHPLKNGTKRSLFCWNCNNCLLTTMDLNCYRLQLWNNYECWASEWSEWNESNELSVIEFLKWWYLQLYDISEIHIVTCLKVRSSNYLMCH